MTMHPHDSSDTYDEEESRNPGRGWLIGGGLSILLWILIILAIRQLF
ncbi:hypothetical protein ACFQZR_00450 [Paenibacillus sp. GCM10027629]